MVALCTPLRFCTSSHGRFHVCRPFMTLQQAPAPRPASSGVWGNLFAYFDFHGLWPAGC